MAGNISIAIFFLLPSATYFIFVLAIVPTMGLDEPLRKRLLFIGVIMLLTIIVSGIFLGFKVLIWGPIILISLAVMWSSELMQDMGTNTSSIKWLFVIGIMTFVLVAMPSLLNFSAPETFNNGGGCGGECFPPPVSIHKVQITYPRIMEMSSSEPITVALEAYALENTSLELSLWGTGIEISPEETRTISIPDGSSTSELVWIIHPKELGTYTFNLETSTGIEHISYTFKTTIVTLFGINVFQAKILGAIGGFLGSALTLPGFITYLGMLWKKYKNRSNNEEKDNPPPRKTKIIISASGQEKEIIEEDVDEADP